MREISRSQKTILFFLSVLLFIFYPNIRKVYAVPTDTPTATTTPVPGTVQVSVGPASPVNYLSYPTGSIDAAIFQYQLVNADSIPLTMSQVNFSTYFSGPIPDGIVNLKLYRDINENGAKDAGDALLGTATGNFDNSIATVNYSEVLSPYEVGAYLVTYDFLATVMPGGSKYYGVSIINPTDFIGTRGAGPVSFTGLPIHGGSIIIPWPTVTMTFTNTYTPTPTPTGSPTSTPNTTTPTKTPTPGSVFVTTVGFYDSTQIPGASAVPALVFKMTNNVFNRSVTVTGLVVTSSGTGNEASGISSADLYLDANLNSLVDGSDVLLASSSYTLDDGAVSLGFSLPMTYLASYNLLLANNYTASAAGSFQASIPNSSDLIGLDAYGSLSFAGLPFPYDWATITITNPTPTPTGTWYASTATDTPSNSPSATPTITPTNTFDSTTPTFIATFTGTPGPNTNTPTSTNTETFTSTGTNTPTMTSTLTGTWATSTPTNSPSKTPTSTPTNTTSVTPTMTPTRTVTNTITPCLTCLPTNTFTNTNTSTNTYTPTSTFTSTPTGTWLTSTATKTPTNSPSLTPSNTLSITPTKTGTSSWTLTKTFTSTPSPTGTWLTSTPTNSPSDTPTRTPTNTVTNTITPGGMTSTATNSPTVTITSTWTSTLTSTMTPTPSGTWVTSTATNSPSQTPTRTPTNTVTDTLTPGGMTSTAIITPTVTITTTWTSTPTFTPTLNLSPTPTPVGTPIAAGSLIINPALPASLSLSDGTTITMPANSFTQPITVTVSKYAAASAPATATAFQVIFLSDVYVIDTGGVEPQTSSAVTVTLPYNPADIPSPYTAADLTLTYFDGTQWIVLSSTVDTVNHTVTVVTNHFSWWAAALQNLSPTPTRTTTPPPAVVPGGTKPVVYPNPAIGPQVKVALPLTVAGDVKVQIYTLSFRKVTDLVVRNVQPGTAITVDLLDKAGARLSNGLYYLTVTLPDSGRHVLKLLVTR